VIERELKIKTLADELANGHRDIDSYISAIRHCVVSFDIFHPLIKSVNTATMYISLIDTHLAPD